jgi:hypothetical protein
MPETLSPDVAVFTPPVRDLGVDNALICSDLGYRDGAPDMIKELIDEVLPLVISRLNLRCGFRILPAESVKLTIGTVSVQGVDFSTGPIISNELKHSTSAAFFAATAGPRLEQWAGEVMASGDMMRGYIIDAIASEYVTQASEWLEHRVEEEAGKRGWQISNRYSPGHCDWPVSEQHKLFSFLPENFCGITLTESSLMIPIKSVSGVIGLGRDVKRGAFQCAICEFKDCFRRRDEPKPAVEIE